MEKFYRLVAAAASGSSSVLPSTVTSLTTASPGASARLSLFAQGLVKSIGVLAVHFDGFVVFGLVCRGFVPASKIVEGAFTGGVVQAVACATGIRETRICRSIKLISAGAEERQPFGMSVRVDSGGGGVDVEKGDGGAFFYNLEGDYIEVFDDFIKDIIGREMGVGGIMVYINEIPEFVFAISHD